jgi:hypothetical protein
VQIYVAFICDCFLDVVERSWLPGAVSSESGPCAQVVLSLLLSLKGVLVRDFHTSSLRRVQPGFDPIMQMAQLGASFV